MTVAYSQTGIPAIVQITPGPGVAFTGQGAAGVGIAGASLDANGHLQMLRTDAVTVDVGRVGRVVAAVAASGSSAADGTPLSADVSLVLGGVAGGVLVLTGGLNASRKVVNKLTVDVPVLPPAGSQIDTLGVGVALPVAAGATLEFHSPDGLSWTSEG